MTQTISIEERVKGIIAEYSDVPSEKITNDLELRYLVDSLQVIEVEMKCEEVFGFEVSLTMSPFIDDGFGERLFSSEVPLTVGDVVQKVQEVQNDLL